MDTQNLKVIEGVLASCPFRACSRQKLRIEQDAVVRRVHVA